MSTEWYLLWYCVGHLLNQIYCSHHLYCKWHLEVQMDSERNSENKRIKMRNRINLCIHALSSDILFKDYVTKEIKKVPWTQKGTLKIKRIKMRNRINLCIHALSWDILFKDYVTKEIKKVPYPTTTHLQLILKKDEKANHIDHP